MPSFNRTKIVVTLGPASWSADTIAQLFEAGADVFRINMSHSDTEFAAELVERVRGVSDRVAVLIDTKGPELRTTNVDEDEELVELIHGDHVEVRSGTDELTTDEVIYVKHDGIVSHLAPGVRIHLDDGLLRLVVETIDADETSATCLVERGGELTSRRGVNIPGVHVFPPQLTENDQQSIRMAGRLDVDFLAASFVQNNDDVERIRALLNEEGAHTHIIAKIETRAAVDDLDDIIAASDGIMVARGDLGVEIPAEEVPLVQKDMVRRCNRVGKPVIVATQMLESMIEHPIPTRAETSDVANAIIDGTDAVMLSGETAKGAFPVESVNTLVRVSDHVEQNADLFRTALYSSQATSTADFIAKAVCRCAQDLEVAAIVALTRGGATARLVCRYKPPTTILASTPDIRVARKLMLSYAVMPFVADHAEHTEKGIGRAIKSFVEAGVLNLDDRVVITFGAPMNAAGTTNFLGCDTARTLLTRES